MLKGVDLFEEVFEEEMEENGDLDLREIEEVDGVTNYIDEINYNSGWYNYHTVTFKYEGKKYSFDYKSHTSDNVCDEHYDYDSFQEVVVPADLKLDKEWYSLDEVVTLLKLDPQEILKLLEEIEEDE